jgi:hypothetical protein
MVYQENKFLEIYTFQEWGNSTFVVLFFCSSIMGMVLTVSIFKCTQFNSALTTTVIGCLKNVLISYGGMFIGGDYLFSLVNFLGTVPVFDRNLRSRMPIVPTPARLKRVCVLPMPFLSGVHSWAFTPLTGWHCKFRPNTEGLNISIIGSLAYSYNVFLAKANASQPVVTTREYKIDLYVAPKEWSCLLLQDERMVLSLSDCCSAETG